MKLALLPIAVSFAQKTGTANSGDVRVGNPDQIIEDELYWCCRDGKSDASCVNGLKTKLDLYTLGNWACAITSTMPAYAWQNAEGYNDTCGTYACCGPDGGTYPDFRTFDQACMAASATCGSDLSCARDYIVRCKYDS